MGGEQGRRRARRRASAPAGPPPQQRPEPAGEPVAAPPPADRRPARPARREHHGHQGLGDLVGSGRSQLGVTAALRGRDVNRPTEQDLAEAERAVVLVRRHWKPPPT